MKEPDYFKRIDGHWPSYNDTMRGKKCQFCERHAETFSIKPKSQTKVYYCRELCRNAAEQKDEV